MAFIIILALIILNGYFSLAEIALVSVNDVELAVEQSRHNPKAVQVLQLIRDPEEFLSAVQVGITLLGLLEGIYGGNIVAVQLEKWLAGMGMSFFTAHVTSLIIGIGAITYLSIVFGELVPKAIALRIPLKISLAIAPSLHLFERILYPFIKLLTLSTRFILSSFSIKAANNEKITEKDLKSMLGAAYKQGLLGKQQLFLHENVLAFDGLKAKSIMKPARIIVCLDHDWNRDKVLEAIRQRPYSYFPIYQKEQANIVGILRTKDFFLQREDDWRRNIHSNCSIPQEAAAKDIFSKFKEKKIDFGVVRDEQGKFLGVVAMQDIMEGIFGDMPELEDYSAYFYKQSDKEWIAEDFIHLQRIRTTLSLPWLREYETRYLSLSELFAGESSQLTNGNTLRLNDVTFRIIAGTPADPQRISITLP